MMLQHSDFIKRVAVHMLDTADQDVDTEFPPLQSEDPIHKFDFDSLALVEERSRGETTSGNQSPGQQQQQSSPRQQAPMVLVVV